jgi:hypothetical protein
LSGGKLWCSRGGCGALASGDEDHHGKEGGKELSGVHACLNNKERAQ